MLKLNQKPFLLQEREATDARPTHILTSFKLLHLALDVDIATSNSSKDSLRKRQAIIISILAITRDKLRDPSFLQFMERRGSTTAPAVGMPTARAVGMDSDGVHARSRMGRAGSHRRLTSLTRSHPHTRGLHPRIRFAQAYESFFTE